MFSNRFNTRNDPLLEAAAAAMKDGETRRQAEAYVNEQFGVYSRKAVVREELAAYDAALEEAYGALKEGKSLDPVGREDKDIDNDGDHDKSDKYLLNRRKTIGRAMGKKMEEGTAEAETSMSVTKDNKPSTPAQTNASTSGPSASDKAALASKIKTMREEEQFDEAAYSAKAARAGKDIGKPGKQFSKIAKSAGKKYGSEERGKKVAGAILARIRAKHMKESIFSDNIDAMKKAFGFGNKGQSELGQSSDTTAAQIPSGTTSVSVKSQSISPSQEPKGTMKGATMSTGTRRIASQPLDTYKAGTSKTSTSKSTSAPTSTATKGGFFKGSPNVSKGDYTIGKGDTLSGIAKKYGTSVGAIQSMNKGLTNVNKISAGGKLNLPTTTGPKPDTSNIKPLPSTQGSGYSQSAERMKAMSTAKPSTPTASSSTPATSATATTPTASSSAASGSMLSPNPIGGAGTSSTFQKTPSAGPAGGSFSGGTGGAGGAAGAGAGGGSGGAGGAGIGAGSRGGKGGAGGRSLNESVQIGDYKYRII